ncbi:hypothetical protein RRF57_013182 [Xylaria bambusicola]|uniref:Uncharacterized protein n=1 Tax=Xylaria bambusicola TaxID=326684 RepID=A0AAN7UWE8_9PEZI
MEPRLTRRRKSMNILPAKSVHAQSQVTRSPPLDSQCGIHANDFPAGEFADRVLRGRVLFGKQGINIGANATRPKADAKHSNQQRRQGSNRL